MEEKERKDGKLKEHWRDKKKRILDTIIEM